MHFDAHCHLNAIKNAEKIIEKCEKNDFKGICTASTDLESMKKNLELSKKSNIIVSCLGIHPNDSIYLNKKELEKSFLFLKKNIENVRAVGEIGLDFKHATTEKLKKKQLEVFEKQIYLAEKYSLPIVVHGRRAYKECTELLAERFNGRILFHWFLASKKVLQKASKQKSFFSFGPNIVLNNSTKKVVGFVPEKRVLCETDAPVPFKEKKTTPLNIIQTEKELAKILGKKPECLQKNIKKSFKKLFKE